MAMRKLNTYLSLALCLVFLLHLVMGSFMILGIGHNGGKLLAIAGACALVIHVALSAYSTGRTMTRLGLRHLLQYGWANRLFWLRRLSGLAILILLFGHIGLFGAVIDGQYVLFDFTWPKALLQGTFLTALCVHIATNMRPLFVSLGWSGIAGRCRDVYASLVVFYLFSIVALIIYYVGWQL